MTSRIDSVTRSRSGFFDGLGEKVALLLILALAFGLRVYRLDGQSFWNDEGISAVMAARSPREILLNSAGDVHPPLYYLLLHWWAGAVGHSEFSLRFLSLLFGVMVVALTYGIGKALLGSPMALTGAFFSALSPFQVYYSQEARMYAQMAALSALSIYFCWRLIRYWQGVAHYGGSGTGTTGLSFLKEGWLWLAYVFTTAAAIYTQYFVLALVALENLFFVLVFWPFRRSSSFLKEGWFWWWGGQGMIGLAFAPWLGALMSQFSSWSREGSPIGAGKFLETVFYVFSLGRGWEGVAWIWVIPFLALFIIGVGVALWDLMRGDKLPGELALSSSSLKRGSYGLLVLWLVVPVFLLYLAAQMRPLYFPEYVKLVLPSSPSFSLLMGVGVIFLGHILASFPYPKWAGLLMVFLVLILAGVGSLQALSSYYHDAKYSRDDYRGLAEYIENAARPGDAIIIEASGQKEVFNYYYAGGLAQYNLPKERPIDEEAAIKEMGAILSRHSRIWAVLWAVQETDPNQVVEKWLAQNAFMGFRRWFGGVELAFYDAPLAREVRTSLEDSRQWELGNEARLLGYRIDGGIRSNDGTAALRPGDVIQLTLLWEAEKVKGRYKVFSHLLDDKGYIWGQHDSEPAGGTRPTTTWQPGEKVMDHHGIPIYLGTPPGRYQIEVGLYEVKSGARVPVLGNEGQRMADFVAFGQVDVLKGPPPALEALQMQLKVDAVFGPLRLLGYDVAQLGIEEPADTFPKGAILHVTLYWQAQVKPEKDYAVLVQLQDEKRNVVFSRQVQPVEGAYPTGQWDEKELVADQHKFPLDVPPGRYQLLLGVKDGGGFVPPTGGSSYLRQDTFILKTIRVEG